MDELLKMSLDIHIFSVVASIIFCIVNLFIIKNVENYIAMTKKVEMFTPIYYFFISLAMFTGFVMWAVSRFKFDISVYLMVLSFIAIIVGAAKSYKLFKKTRIKDKNSQKVFREFAIKKYIFDAILLILVAFLAFLLPA